MTCQYIPTTAAHRPYLHPLRTLSPQQRTGWLGHFVRVERRLSTVWSRKCTMNSGRGKHLTAFIRSLPSAKIFIGGNSNFITTPASFYVNWSVANWNMKCFRASSCFAEIFLWKLFDFIKCKIYFSRTFCQRGVLVWSAAGPARPHGSCCKLSFLTQSKLDTIYHCLLDC